jgi:hypothetical protein
MLKLILAGAVAVPVAGAGVVAATGVAWVDVREGGGGGTRIVLPVPLALAETAAAFVPEPIRDAAGHRLNRANRMAAAIGW